MSQATRLQSINTYGSTGHVYLFVRKIRYWQKFGLLHGKLYSLSHLWLLKSNILAQTKLKPYTSIGWHLVTFRHLKLNRKPRKPNKNNLWNPNRNAIPLVQENIHHIWRHTSKFPMTILFLLIFTNRPPLQHFGFGSIFLICASMFTCLNCTSLVISDDNDAHCLGRR